MATEPTCCGQPMQDRTTQEVASWGVAEYTCLLCRHTLYPALPLNERYPNNQPTATTLAAQAGRRFWLMTIGPANAAGLHAAVFVNNAGVHATHYLGAAEVAALRELRLPLAPITWRTAGEHVAKMDADSRDNLHRALHDQQHLAETAAIKVKGKWRWSFTKDRLHSVQLIDFWFTWRRGQKPGSYEQFRLRIDCGWWRFELIRRFLADSDPYWRTHKH